MILVDTDIWADYFNGLDSIYTDALDMALLEGFVILGDLIFLEVLQGFGRDQDFEKAKLTLDTLDQYEMFGNNMAIKCAENYQKLRISGISIKYSTDLIIATFCIENKIPLLFQNRKLFPFVDKLGLTLALVET